MSVQILGAGVKLAKVGSLIEGAKVVSLAKSASLAKLGLELAAGVKTLGLTQGKLDLLDNMGKEAFVQTLQELGLEVVNVDGKQVVKQVLAVVTEAGVDGNAFMAASVKIPTGDSAVTTLGQTGKVAVDVAVLNAAEGDKANGSKDAGAKADAIAGKE